MLRVGFAVVDVETTGLSVGYDKIVEIAVITADVHGELIDVWHSQVDPEQWIPWEATEVHGITECEAELAPTIKALAGPILTRLAGRVIVCHNTDFDLGFLDPELFEPHGWNRPWSICTLQAARRHLRAGSRALGDCVKLLGVPDYPSAAHTALGDALMTWGVMRRMLRRGWLAEVDWKLRSAAADPPLALDGLPTAPPCPRACMGITDEDGAVSFNQLLHLAELPPEPHPGTEGFTPGSR